MAWYDIGTVSVTNGSATVTGSGTNFIAGAQIGEAFYGPDDRLYEIQAIVSATSLTLGSPYLGANQTGQDYYIIPTQSLVANLASQVSTLISDFQSVADEAGEGKFNNGTAALPGITFNLDQDTGFSRPAANQIGFSTAGVQRALLSSTALTLNVPVSGTTGSFSGDATISGLTVGRGAGGISTNTAVGSGALSSNTTGSNNTAVGDLAMRDITTGLQNVAIGQGALLNSTTGVNNTAIGFSSALNATSDNNTAVGRFALRNLTTGSGNIALGANAGDADLGDNNTIIGRIAGTAGLSHTVIIGAGTNERMRITAGGNVGIGTASPTKLLTVNGTGFFTGNLYVGSTAVDFPGVGNTNTGLMVEKTADGASLFVSRAANSPLGLNRNTDGALAGFRRSGTVVGSIAVTTTTTSYNTSSDYRLKEDVQPLVGASDRVLSLKPCNFAWKADGTRTDGFIAHEAQAVVPEAVTGDKDGDEMQAIDQSKLVPLLTAALQDALKRIEALEAQLT